MNIEKGIAAACFTGAALGSLLALQFGYLWWVGILLGGALGYFLFRLEEALQAMRRAWRSLPEANVVVAFVRDGAWNILRAAGAVLAMLCFGTSILILIMGLAMSLVMGAEPPVVWQNQTEELEPLGVPAHYFFIGAAVLLFLAVLILGCIIMVAKDRKAALKTIMSAFLLTPLVLPFTLAFAIGSALLPHACKGCARVAVLGLKLTRQTFILIHSEIRLLCLTDAMLGALVGYLCGNALIGGIIGAVCGLANYKLVSVKWLKLVKSS